MNSTGGARSSGGLTWFKSSYSGSEGGDCVEVAGPAGAVLAGAQSRREPDCAGRSGGRVMNSRARAGNSGDVRWRKSSHSGSEGGNCVEVAGPAGAVLVRDSKCPGGPVLSTTPGAWAAFLRFADGTS